MKVLLDHIQCYHLAHLQPYFHIKLASPLKVTHWLLSERLCIDFRGYVTYSQGFLVQGVGPNAEHFYVLKANGCRKWRKDPLDEVLLNPTKQNK